MVIVVVGSNLTVNPSRWWWLSWRPGSGVVVVVVESIRSHSVAFVVGSFFAAIFFFRLHSNTARRWVKRRQCRKEGGTVATGHGSHEAAFSCSMVSFEGRGFFS